MLEEPWAAFSFADEHAATRPRRRDRRARDRPARRRPARQRRHDRRRHPDEIRAFEQLLDELRTLVAGRSRSCSSTMRTAPARSPAPGSASPTRSSMSPAKATAAPASTGRRPDGRAQLHGTTTQLVWADGESFTVEAKPEVTEDTMADELLEAVRAHPGDSWTKIRDTRHRQHKSAAPQLRRPRPPARDRPARQRRPVRATSSSGITTTQPPPVPSRERHSNGSRCYLRLGRPTRAVPPFPT